MTATILTPAAGVFVAIGAIGLILALFWYLRKNSRRSK